MRDAIQIRRPTWPTLILLLPLPLLAGPTEAAGKVRSDWSKVQAVSPGTRVTVLLYFEEGVPQRGGRKVVGRFASASAENVTLLTPGGGSLTLERPAVQKFRVRRPIMKRRWAWIGFAIVAAAWNLTFVRTLHASEFYDAGQYLGVQAVGTVPALALPFLVSRTAEIYNVPPANRDP